jgi:hypothetical protein
MALALYNVLAPFALNVVPNDFSGARAAPTMIQPNTAFVGNTTDPNVVAWLGAGLIALIHADASGYLSQYAGVTAGMNGSELAMMLLTGIYNAA